MHIISAFLPLPLCLTALHPFITLQVQCGTCHHTTAVSQHSGVSLYSNLAASHSTLLHVLTALQLYPIQHSGHIAAHCCIHLLLQQCIAAHCCIHLLLQHTAACPYNTSSTAAYFCVHLLLQHTAACLYNTLVALQYTAASLYNTLAELQHTATEFHPCPLLVLLSI